MSRWRWTLALALAVVCHQTHAQDPAPLALEVTVNGEARGTFLLLQEGNELLVSQDDARDWRLRLPASPRVIYRGQAFNPLSSLGLTVTRLDLAAQRIDLRAEPAAFEASALALPSVEYQLTPATWGAFAAYDLVGTWVDRAAAVDGAFTLSAFAPLGSLSHQFVERNIWADGNAERSTQRFATTFRRDWSERMVSMEAGDAISRPGAFGQPLRFGGLNVGSNFALRPGFIRQPLPDLGGAASLPSTVEVFVQNQLRSTTQVPAGPFTLDSVPVISGAGDARVVVRDALGREQIVTSSFYVAGGLLRPGLTDWNIGLGKLRDDAGGDANYGRRFATFFARRGLTNALTAELRAEFEEDRTRVAGGALDVGGLWGEFEATGGVANVDGVGRRAIVGAGYRYLTLDYNLGVRWTQAQRGFRQAGDNDLDLTPRRIVTASGGGRLGGAWSAGVAWLGIERQDGTVTRSFNASANWSIAPSVSLLFAYNRISERGVARSVGSIIVSTALGARTTASAGFDGGSERRQFAAIQRSLPFDEGWGYRASLNRFSNRTRVEAGAAVNLPAATLTAEVADEAQRRPAARLGLAGSAAVIEDKAFVARQITDSFVLVRIPDVADAPIFLNNQPAGVTDAQGRLVLPRVSAYVPHQIRVDVDALPPDAEITRDRETAVPPFRSGVVVTLGVRRTAAALVKVVDAAGRPLESGAAVSVEPEGNATSVAQGGAFFLRAESGRKRATITRRGESCRIEFDLAASDVGAYRTLGPYTCVP